MSIILEEIFNEDKKNPKTCRLRCTRCKRIFRSVLQTYLLGNIGCAPCDEKKMIKVKFQLKELKNAAIYRAFHLHK